MNASYMEFHVSKKVRDLCGFDDTLFSSTGNIVFTNITAVRTFTKQFNDTLDPNTESNKMLKAGQLNAMGLIDEIFHYMCYLFRKEAQKNSFESALEELEKQLGKQEVDRLLLEFTTEFPPTAVYRGEITIDDYLNSNDANSGVSHRVTTYEEMIMLHLANENPAFRPFLQLYSDEVLTRNPAYAKSWNITKDFFKTQPIFGPNGNDLITLLKEPVEFNPTDIQEQLDYIRTHWIKLLGEWSTRLLAGADLISEENKPGWSPHFFGPPPMDAYSYDHLSKEYERYSPDRDWMPCVVLMAKTVLVWLDQLSKKYNRSITRLDEIPNEELDTLAQQGFTGLWLIGIWERSYASKRIKQINGNPEAAASAYSLEDYEIAHCLGGWEALGNLRHRLWERGIRLASDMVPNHTGMDSDWMYNRPDLFVQRTECPFPTYTFNGENLSQKPGMGIYLDDQYYSKTDCAVVFKRVDFSNGDTRYIYHGNDGTGMPWNDTAQIDFLNPQAREEVIQKILHVARNFPIIRFDAAMVLAKKHIKRLWYPEPGRGGDIPTRSENALSVADFEERIPNEFWREVVDRCAKEIPDTLLLAEAFWMMEGYFVRTLGMHRVYNSAFMNMLKKEENQKYRSTVKNTMEFDPQVLKRFVNFMNNPDEETAVAQFGKGDKYFGVCTLMITMPGLPMFGHGQIEGFNEKYGMEYQKAYWDEQPDQYLIERHNKEIFPLAKKRYLFAEVEHFYFYDVRNEHGVNENIFAYSNRCDKESAIVFYNNAYEHAHGWITHSCSKAEKTNGDMMQLHTKTLGNALGLSTKENTFCIFQEQRSGLWYIRTSKEIHDNGFFVSLNGFETQVFMNFTEVADDKTGKYRTVYEALDGAGVHDITVAMNEIFLKDLYESFTGFATVEFFEQITTIFMPEIQKKGRGIKPIKTQSALNSIKEKAIAFFDVFDTFAEGNYGAQEIFNKKKVGARIDSEAIWKKFVTTVKNLENIKSLAETAKDPTQRSAKFARALYEAILNRPFMAEILAGFAILSTVQELIGKKATAEQAVELIKLWQLDRKVIEVLEGYKVPVIESSSSLNTLLFAYVSAGEVSNRKTDIENAYAMMYKIISHKDAAQMLGLNRYDGILWFKEEKMHFVLWALATIHAMSQPTEAAFEKHVCLYKYIREMTDAAQYDSEKLLEMLLPPEKKIKTQKTNAKPSGVKKAASTKTAKKTK